MRLRIVLALFVCAAALPADDITYQRAPKQIEDVLNAPATPSLSISPARTHVILAQPLRYPPITEVAAPMLRLAGLRIDPRTNGPHLPASFIKLTLKRVSDGNETVIALPAGIEARHASLESGRQQIRVHEHNGRSRGVVGGGDGDRESASS